jgi:putative DNA primase/helicase
MPQNSQSRAIIERLHGNHQGMCLCPCHDDRNPSLHVTGKEDGKVLLYCHAGCPQEDLITWCKENGLWHLPMRRAVQVVDFRPIHEQRQRRQQRDEQDDSEQQHVQDDTDEQQEEGDSDYDRKRIAYYVLRIAAKHAQANPNARDQLLPYFNGRGIKAVPAGAMYLPAAPVCTIMRNYPECALQLFPSVAQATCDAQGRLRGALITQLTKDSSSNLRIDGKSVRRIVGPSKHAFVQVTTAWPTRDRPLLAAEGVEKAAAVAELLKEQGYPAIATLGTANMRNNMPLPPCAEVIIAADHGEAGTKAAKAMAGHIKRAGGTARIVFPPADFKDWDEAIKTAHRAADTDNTLAELSRDVPVRASIRRRGRGRRYRQAPRQRWPKF